MEEIKIAIAQKNKLFFNYDYILSINKNYFRIEEKNISYFLMVKLKVFIDKINNFLYKTNNIVKEIKYKLKNKKTCGHCGKKFAFKHKCKRYRIKFIERKIGLKNFLVKTLFNEQKWR